MTAYIFWNVGYFESYEILLIIASDNKILKLFLFYPEKVECTAMLLGTE